jgi:hypothetical protein
MKCSCGCCNHGAEPAHVTFAEPANITFTTNSAITFNGEIDPDALHKALLKYKRQMVTLGLS